MFWAHLACGVAAGLVIAMMSVTGVLLTYERQMLAWAERAHVPPPPADAVPQSVDALLAAVRTAQPDFVPTAVTIASDPAAPLTLAAGRDGSLLVDRYTGAVLERGGERLRAFFAATTGWHRWFNATGESRTLARAITGASNLAFLFLVLSGVYLWLPPVAKWVAFKTRLWFNPRATTSKARDFNWHHVFGIWSAVPLAVVVATAVVFSYPWANALVYRSFGEEPPARGAGRGGPPAASPTDRAAANNAAARAAEGFTSNDAPLPLDALIERASAHVQDWRTLTIDLPPDGAARPTVRIAVDQGNGGQPQRRHTLVLDAYTGEVAAWQPFASQTPGQQARSWIRFLHTGEALGVAGQTVAGIVSLTSVIMVWTGLALAYRRLIAPLFRRR